MGEPTPLRRLPCGGVRSQDGDSGPPILVEAGVVEEWGRGSQERKPSRPHFPFSPSSQIPTVKQVICLSVSYATLLLHPYLQICYHLIDIFHLGVSRKIKANMVCISLRTSC